MADDRKAPEAFTLKRWSQRKLAAAKAAPVEPLPPDVAPPIVAPVTIDAEHSQATVPENSSLPPVESLTFESDFSPFMQPKIDEATKRAALRKLFSDPSFNVMDGLDIYVGDYTQPDPMPAGMLERLSTVYAMLDPVDPPPVDEDAQPDAQPAPARVAPDRDAEIPVPTDGDTPPAISTPPTGPADLDLDAEPKAKPE
jgi:Protein of unknown function (DUF3306)